MARKTPFQKDLANSKTGNKKSPVKKIELTINDILKYFTGKKKNMGGAIMKNRGGSFKGTR